MSIPVYSVADVRAAEEQLMNRLPDGTLMQRASLGLASVVARLLREIRGGVAGTGVVILVGSGNNGGDALWAGAELARRGARVVALTLSDRWHVEGMSALVRAGGSAVAAEDLAPGVGAELVDDADVVLDGITGIGGRGALRGLAADAAAWATASSGLVIAVDVPSGVDADTGAVADDQACVTADLTVTFGCAKPGLYVAPGRFYAGGVRMVDIGLDATLPEATCTFLDDLDLAVNVPEPGGSDYKYSRGVVGIAAGSATYRGAGFLATDAARSSGVGMVRYLGRDTELAHRVVDEFWDVVASPDVHERRLTAVAIGPGWGTDSTAQETLDEVLGLDLPVVFDADALRLLSDGHRRSTLRERGERGGISVLTPHEGEFVGLGFVIGSDRVDAARRAAVDLASIVVLKGPGTIVAAPDGQAYIDTFGTAELGTAGSGDVLTGLLGGMLAAAHARSGGISIDAAARVAAAAVGLHGIAGRVAAEAAQPVTAQSIAASIPAAIGRVRRR